MKDVWELRKSANNWNTNCKWEGQKEHLLNELQEVRQCTSELWDLSRDHADISRKMGAEDATAVHEVGETNRVSIGVEVSGLVSQAPDNSSLRHRTSSPAVTQPCLNNVGSSSLIPSNSGLSWTAPMLAHQLPPMQQFTGKETTRVVRSLKIGLNCWRWLHPSVAGTNGPN